jgi:outer membrane protein assembly factor BamA
VSFVTFVPLWFALLLAQAAPAQEVLAQVQVRGNVATADAEVQRLGGLEIGMAVTPETVAAVTAKLRASKRFDSVEVQKRYASLSDPTQVVLVVVVDEGPVRIVRTGDPDQPTRVVQKWLPNLLLLPILGRESGYGITYGARVTHAEPFGRDSRLSFPLTWGATKQAAAEFEKRLPDSWLTRVEAGGGVTRRVNPRYGVEDDRANVYFRVERQFTQALRVRGLTSLQHVTFGAVPDRVATAGAEVIFDNRLDPFLARNAVYARATESHLAFGNRQGVNRTDLEAHGYLGLIGQAILVASATSNTSDGPLPAYLKPLFGGPSNVRGFEVGAAAGDSLVAGSLEVRVPLTPALSFGKVGVSGFVDTGTVYNDGQRLADQTWQRGVGGSVWFAAAFLRVNVAVAHGIGASTHAYAQFDLQF